MESKFPNDKINYFKRNNTTIVDVRCDKKKKIESSLKPFIINGRKPVCRTFVRVLCDNKSLSEEIINNIEIEELFLTLLEYPESTYIF